MRGSMKAWGMAMIVALGVAPSLAQTTGGHTGRLGVYVPEPTSTGTWEGTWSYNSADAKMVLWMRTHKNRTEVKLRYESGRKPLTFETDWNGDASYYTAERPATFRLHLTRSHPDRIEGTWTWDSPFGNATRNENGIFTLSRALDGRTLVFAFNEYDLSITRGARVTQSSTPPVWTFSKVSKRQALWDEIPF